MIGIFTLIMIAPKPYHDRAALRAGLVESKFIYEEDFYPALKAIDYQGFVRE